MSSLPPIIYSRHWIKSYSQHVLCVFNDMRQDIAAPYNHCHRRASTLTRYRAFHNGITRLSPIGFSPLPAFGFRSQPISRNQKQIAPSLGNKPDHFELDSSLITGTPLDLELSRRLPVNIAQLQSTTTQLENLRFLDYYDDWLHTDIVQPPPYRIVIPNQDDTSTASIGSVQGDQTDQAIMKTTKMLDLGLKHGKLTRETILELYRNLPQPGISFLESKTRHLLLVKLSQVDVREKNESAMLQFLSVFDDMHTAGITPQYWHWATAMHLTGRCFKKVTISELENAMRIWRRMEEQAGIRSNTHTMNILLDVSLKSNQLDIAELVLEEMRERQLKFDRVTYLGIIYLKGLKGDGNGIREVYKKFVMANEVVDTMALTCVIAALLHAGEPSAAMNVYGRMFTCALPGQDTSENSPRKVWDMGRLLAKSSAGDDLDAIADYQNEVSVRPNLITYTNLIGYHADHSGDLVAIVGLLDDMQVAGVAVHGSIFIALFRGFSRHGNKMYTSWTQDRLEEVWQAFKRLQEAGKKDVFVGPKVAVAVLSAYKECIGRARALQVLEEIRERWRKLDESHEFCEGMLKHASGLSPSLAPSKPRKGRAEEFCLTNT